MPLQVTISSLSGTPNYNVYVCDSMGASCTYVTTIAGPSAVINVPPPLDNDLNICVKIIDALGCEILYCNSTPAVSPSVSPTPSVTPSSSPAAVSTLFMFIPNL